MVVAFDTVCNHPNGNKLFIICVCLISSVFDFVRSTSSPNLKFKAILKYLIFKLMNQLMIPVSPFCISIDMKCNI